MRERFLGAFDEVTVDCLNGDKYKTGKLTPAGEPDPSVFSTEHNREGIQVGTAIATQVRRRAVECGDLSPLSAGDLSPSAGKTRPMFAGPQPRGSASPASRRSDKGGDGSPHSTAAVRFRHFWGKTKREDLLAALERPKKQPYATLKPAVELGFPFVPAVVSSHYLGWSKLPELLPVSFPGVKTSRDEALVSTVQGDLEARMRRYFDPKVSDEELREEWPALMKSSARFDAKVVRVQLLQRGRSVGRIVHYLYRPFDARWLYWHPDTKLLDEKRTDYVAQVFPGNLWLSAGQQNRKDDFYAPQVTTVLADHHLVESNVGMFPLYLREEAVSYEPAALREVPELFSPGDMHGVGGGGGGSHANETRPNLSPKAAAWLIKLGAKPESLFFHLVATLHSPAYRRENAGALRQDWPRIPLPASKSVLEASAKLGRELAALLDSETPVAGVTKEKFRPELKSIAPMQGTDLEITAGWGIAGKGGIVMPGKGRLTEVAPPADRPAAFGTGPDLNVWLNATTRWTHVPAAVWDYTLGGYPVLKKWLSYRETKLLGRPLAPEEAVEFTRIARRIAAILLLAPALDASYAAVKAGSPA